MPIQNDRVARFVEMTGEREAATLDEMFQRMTTPVSGIEGGKPEGLPAICAAWDVPYGRVMAWLMADAGRYGVYKRALEVAAHGLVAQVIDIADSDSPYVQRDKLKITTRKWIAEQHASDIYRPRSTVDMNVSHAGWGDRLRRARERVIEVESAEADDDGEI